MNSRKVFATLTCAILVLATSFAMAQGHNDPAAYRLITGDAEESPPTFSVMPMDQPPGIDCCNPGCCNPDCCQRCCRACWTASADFIILDRAGSVDRTLVRSTPTRTTYNTGAEVLNAEDFQQGFFGGPRVGLIRRGCCYDLELLYFQIDGWSSTRQVLHDDNILYLTAPGPLIFLNQGETIQTEYASKLYNAEFNVRWNPLCRLTMLAGFRYLELRENLDWGRLYEGVTPPIFYNDWNTNTINNLYGFQIGADGLILDCCCFSIDGLVKAGIFGNHAEQATIAAAEGPFIASTNHTAFLGEVGVQCKYQVTKGLVLRAGYEAIWLQGLALAPGQIDETNIITGDIGINANSGVFYHGATAGFEYTF